MFKFEANEAVVLEQKQVLETALSTNPKALQVLRKTIRKYVLAARREVMNNVGFNNGDPHEARRAVRTTVYKKVLGANINILNGRKAHDTSTYEPPRQLRPGQRGGNRVKRGTRTDQVMHYAGPDRGFILRFVNSGTGEREAGTRGGRISGSRGRIAPRNFFRPIGDRAMGTMRDNLANAIEAELNEILPHGK